MTQPSETQTKTLFTPRMATTLIIATMVGVGVFTTLGKQLAETDSIPIIMGLWVIGGIAALCGALSYAELGASLPRSGGEYTFLGRAYHPAAGFISGWLSATIGYAAPSAAIALAFARYSNASLPFEISATYQKLLACVLILSLATIHALSRKASGATQTGSTIIKIVLVIAFIAAAFFLTASPQSLNLIPTSKDVEIMTSASLGVALIYVYFAFTGWNAATYISGEMETPQLSLPRVLFTGTAFVTVLFVLLNLAFLYAAPVDALRGEIQIGTIAAEYIFGETGGRLVGAMLALLLISSVSALTLAGPRALQAIGEDYRAMSWLGRSTAEGVPWVAILLQACIAIFFILTQTFGAILVFAGAMVAFNSLLAVIGVFILRWREPKLPRPYKTWGYPIVPLIYILITTTALVSVVKARPLTAYSILGLIALGFVLWLLSEGLNDRRLPRND